MRTFVTVLLVFLVAIGVWWFMKKPAVMPEPISYTATTTSPAPVTPSTTPTPVATSTATSTASSMIKIDLPMVNATVTSPVTVKGQARGNWFFEASAPVKVTDLAGNTLGQGIIQATGDWMTTNFVPFTGSITFTKGTNTKGYIVFMNDNPSGDPARSISTKVPVVFK